MLRDYPKQQKKHLHTHSHTHGKANRFSHIARAKVLLWYLISMLAYTACLPATPTTLLCPVTVPAATVKITRMEKGWNYRVFFACRCWCFLFFSLFPARSLLFSFSGLLLVCVILSPPLPPSARRLFALRYQRISELRHEVSRNFNTSLAAWESPFPLSWASILPYLHSFARSLLWHTARDMYVGHTSALPQEVWQQFMGCS